MKPTGLPLSYQIDKVKVSLSQHPGSPSFPIQRIILSGAGSGTLERDGKSALFDYTEEDLLAILKELYKIRFFDLPEDYTTQYSVFLRNDKTIQTTALRLADSGSTSVCFAVASYKKCITYSQHGPLELEAIVERVFSDADKLVKKVGGKAMP